MQTFNWRDEETYNLFDVDEDLNDDFYGNERQSNTSLVVHQIVTFIDEGISKGATVLVHSLEGTGRSVACCAVYLMAKYGWGLEKSVTYILTANKRDEPPNVGFMKQLKTLDYRLQFLRSTRYSKLPPARRQAALEAAHSRLVEWKTRPCRIEVCGEDDGAEDELVLVNSFINAQTYMSATRLEQGRCFEHAATKLRWNDREGYSNLEKHEDEHAPDRRLPWPRRSILKKKLQREPTTTKQNRRPKSARATYHENTRRAWDSSSSRDLRSARTQQQQRSKSSDPGGHHLHSSGSGHSRSSRTLPPRPSSADAARRNSRRPVFPYTQEISKKIEEYDEDWPNLVICGSKTTSQQRSSSSRRTSRPESEGASSRGSSRRWAQPMSSTNYDPASVYSVRPKTASERSTRRLQRTRGRTHAVRVPAGAFY